MRLRSVPAFLLPWLPCLASAADLPEEGYSRAQIEAFETHVRPVLAEQCYSCHGGHRHENGLRLDSRAAILRGSDYAKVVVPGNPAESKLIHALEGSHGVKRMPMKADPLEARQIAHIADWIAGGLAWPVEPETAVAAGHHRKDPSEHWAFRPVTAPPVPEHAHPVDHLVGLKLDGAGLSLAPRAPARDLVRRVHVSLTGLQPSYEAVARWSGAIQSDGQKAWGELIDELLESPRYGERWARHWLDVARYADTQGYVVAAQDNRFPYSYTYRNWVADAFNADMPFDLFVKRQLAADLQLSKPETLEVAMQPGRGLSGPKEEFRHLAALGFLTVNDRFINDSVLQTDDRIDVVGRGLLGLTIGCARCHDHKYDPIPTSDYYGLYGVFESSTVPEDTRLPVIAPAPDPEAAEEFQQAKADINRQMDEFHHKVMEDLRTVEIVSKHLLFAWRYRDLDLTAFRGTAGKENVRDKIADHWRRFFAATDKSKHPVMTAWQAFAALSPSDFESRAGQVLEGLPLDPKQANPAVIEALRSSGPISSLEQVAAVYARLLVECRSVEPSEDPAREEIRRLVMRPESPMSVEAADANRFFTRKDAGQMVKFRNQLKKLEIESDGAPQRAMVMVDRAKPVDTRIMIRGDRGRRGDPAPRSYLSFFGGQRFEQGSGRGELADLIASKENPLTARVFVNRVWMHHFGQPLVETPSDFGVQTPEPVQAELLDYLAADFMQHGWSVKHLHRRILGSRVYQQSCEVTPEKAEQDADNALLSRMNRRRLDYESIRDNLLQVAGVLEAEKGLPARAIAVNAAGVDQWRTLSLMVDRYVQETVPAMFDFANPDSHNARRFVTTVPQQALFLMNSPFMKRHAEGLAGTLEIAGSAPDSATIRELFRKVVLRDPTPEEVSDCLAFLAQGEESEPDFLWQYGTMEIQHGENGGAPVVGNWKPFTVLDKGQRWSHTGKVPDPAWHYASLGKGSGHPGAVGVVTAASWTAVEPQQVDVAIEVDRHRPEGDGLTVRLWSDRVGWISERPVPAGQKVSFRAEGVEVEEGESLRVLFDCNASASFDSFRWNATITADDGVVTEAEADFCGSDGWPLEGRPRPMSMLAQLCQVLMMSNEFQFLD